MRRFLKVAFLAALVLLVVAGLLLKMPRLNAQELEMAARAEILNQIEAGMRLPDGQTAGAADAERGNAVYHGRFAAVTGGLTADGKPYVYGVLFYKLPFTDQYVCDSRHTQLAPAGTVLLSFSPSYGLTRFHITAGPASLLIGQSADGARAAAVLPLATCLCGLLWRAARRKAAARENGRPETE